MPTCRVLIVDDEDDCSFALATRLKRRGYIAETASDGLSALEAARAFKPDVVLLDVRMPGLDGIEVLARLKQQVPEVAVILLTAHASVHSGIAGMRLGASDYLVKPADIDDLCAKVQAAFESKTKSQ